MDFEHEAMLWGVNPDVSRSDLEALVEQSATPLGRADHRRLHESDFVRWGRRGGLATLKRYGREWFSKLAKRRWGRIPAGELVPVANTTER